MASFFFDLRRIAFPVTAVVSIGHRVSGIALALAIPALVWLFSLSVSSSQTFATVAALFENTTAKLALVVLAWALAHHSLAGVRHLVFDIHELHRHLPQRA